MSALAAAALFTISAPAYADGDCEWDTNGTLVCHIHGDPWPTDWSPGGGSGGGSGGGDQGGGSTGGPAGDAPADNAPLGVAAQERAHQRMFANTCFTAVTGMAPTSANRLAFHDVAATVTIVSVPGSSGDNIGLIADLGQPGIITVKVYDNFRNLAQGARDIAFVEVYWEHYNRPTTAAAASAACPHPQP